MQIHLIWARGKMSFGIISRRHLGQGSDVNRTRLMTLLCFWCVCVCVLGESQDLILGQIAGLRVCVCVCMCVCGRVCVFQQVNNMDFFS